MRQLLLVSLCLALAGSLRASNPCYDHQKQTYKAEFSPAECSQKCTVTPFFSPDHSIDAYMKLINEAQESIDLMEPSFSSWSNCTKYSSDCGGNCIGCTLEDQYKEHFPIFAALMNAVHLRNVKIRFLTNDFSTDTCQGKTSPLDWMALNGVQIHMYTTTTFMHAKAMIVDKGKKTMVSSVNFSYTSFNKNREAGVILEDCTCDALDLYQKVFDSDWDTGYAYEPSQYTSSEMEFITNKDKMPIPDPNIPVPPVPGAYQTAMNTYSDVTINSGYTSPDYARSTFMNMLSSVKSTIKIYIYQITDPEICDKLLDLSNSGVNVSIMATTYIVSYDDYKAAQECYGKLYSGGLRQIQKAYSKFSFAHQKFAIIDNTTIYLSTGNWSPTDFPEGDSWSTSGPSVNRDLQVVMTDPNVVGDFLDVYEHDWYMGQPWEPKRWSSRGAR